MELNNIIFRCKSALYKMNRFRESLRFVYNTSDVLHGPIWTEIKFSCDCGVDAPYQVPFSGLAACTTWAVSYKARTLQTGQDWWNGLASPLFWLRRDNHRSVKSTGTHIFVIVRN